MRRWLAAGILAAALIAPSCTSAINTTDRDTDGSSAMRPVARAVTIATTACGHASKTSGAGVIIGDGRVLASAHVVIGAESVAVTSLADPATSVAATVMHLDTRTDLAVLSAPGLTADPIELAAAAAGDLVAIIGGGPSGAFSTTIDRRVEVRIEQVRSGKRASRFGYELNHRVQLGDSGAGAFDHDGRLVAVIYGRSQGRSDASFAVRDTEIEQALTGATQSWRCDPARHKIVAAG